MVPLSPSALQGLERACSAENRDCVAAKHYYDDWVRGLSELVCANDSLEAVVEHLPGMRGGEVHAVQGEQRVARVRRHLARHGGQLSVPHEGGEGG